MSLQHPSETLIVKWLSQGEVEHYLCGECDGIHLTAIQTLDNVSECRLFADEQGLQISAEADVRPDTMFHLLADLNTFNINYPHLKLFFDTIDQACPKLVITSFFLAGHGVSMEQFELFVQSTIEGAREIIREFNSLEYLGSSSEMVPRTALH